MVFTYEEFAFFGDASAARPRNALISYAFYMRFTHAYTTHKTRARAIVASR